jgi:hypothetical protein
MGDLLEIQTNSICDLLNEANEAADQVRQLTLRKAKGPYTRNLCHWQLNG